MRKVTGEARRVDEEGERRGDEEGERRGEEGEESK